VATLKSWKELPCGAIIEDLSAVKENKTGAWRSQRPVWNKEKCGDKPCLTCWMFCPDASIMVKDGKPTGVHYGYCKGCGICAQVCPKEAIVMEEERK
jgi:pyruvate ferredoxin oxidoreductase delta subunit